MSQPTINHYSNIDPAELAQRLVDVTVGLDHPTDREQSALKFARFMLNSHADRIDALGKMDDLTIVRSAKAIEDSRRRLIQHMNHLLRSSPAFIRTPPLAVLPAKGPLYEDAVEFAGIPQSERRKFLSEMAQEMRHIAESDLPLDDVVALVRDLECRMKSLPAIPGIS